MAFSTRYRFSQQGLTDSELTAWLSGEEPVGGPVELFLDGNALTAKAIAAWERRPLGAVMGLVLSGCPVGDEGARALASGEQFTGLRILHLAGVGLSATGVAHLLGEGSRLDNLTELDLCANPLGDEGARVLARSPGAARLEYLFLDETGLTDRGATALATSPHFGRLETLTLYGNALSPEAIAKLRESGELSNSQIELDQDAE